jgi:hypothetical protein
LRGEVRDLEGQREKARGRLGRAAENLVHWSDQAEEIRAAVAQRSDPGDLLGPAKAALAGHQEYVAASRAAIAAAQAGTPRRAPRPFVSRGSVTRSESCQWCIDQNVSDEDSYLLHSDPELAVPVTSPEQAAAKAERRSRDDYGVAVR